MQMTLNCFSLIQLGGKSLLKMAEGEKYQWVFDYCSPDSPGILEDFGMS
jgi:hypothetical protein